MKNSIDTILIINPRGFCAGVERAIKIVEVALEKYGPPVYIRHEIVHNKHVVDDLKSRGAIFVKEVSEIPDNAVAIFSAHGVSEKVERDAENLNVIDATCPLVKKVHNQAKHLSSTENEIVLIGHAGHPEVEGTIGRVTNKTIHLIQRIDDIDLLPFSIDTPISYITQTTLSVDDTTEIITALKKKFPDTIGPASSDICYATQNRQTAVKKACEIVDLVFVVGSKNSSNSNRLCDIAISHGKKSYLIDKYEDIKDEWLDDSIKKIGITAGASAPEILVQEVVVYLQKKFPEASTVSRDFGINENVIFRMPQI